MDRQTLAALEDAIEPYRRAGFVITTQSEGAITLVYPPAKFSFLLFIALLLIWPLAVIYLVSYTTQRGRSVCLRITSQGYIEVSGYTLEAMAKDRRRRMTVAVLVLAIVVAVILFIIIRISFTGNG